MASEDFQITPLKKYIASDVPQHKPCRPTKTETVTSSDTYVRSAADTSVNCEDISASQSVLDLLDDKMFNRLTLCRNVESRLGSTEGDDVAACGVANLTKDPFHEKTLRSLHDGNVHTEQR